MNLSKETKIGLLATTALVIIYLGLNFLKGKEIFASTNTYYTVYGNAKGLSISEPVLLNGLNVGRVKAISRLPDKAYSVLATLAIDRDIRLTDATIAKLVSNDLLGNRAIELVLKDGNLLQDRDTIPSQVEQDFKETFMESALPTLHDAKYITLLTNQFMTNLVQNTDRINTILANLEAATQKLQQAITVNQKELNAIGKNIAEVSSALSNKETGIKPLLARLNQLSNEVEGVKVKHIAEKLNNILGKIEDGAFHSNLNQALMDLDKLLADLRINPSRYIHFSIFGSKK
ncbi:MAG: MlaD family protein [Bacteroidota bacterium]